MRISAVEKAALGLDSWFHFQAASLTGTAAELALSSIFS